MSVFRKNERVWTDTYEDNYEFPHRKLTARELALLFNTIEERAEECYLQRDHALGHRVEELKDRVVQLTDDVDNNPRATELRNQITALTDALEDAPADTEAALVVERRRLYVEIDTITAPLKAAKAELEKAQCLYDRLRMEVKEAQVIMALQAGQREGLQFGLKIASLLLEGAPIAGIDHKKAPLLVAAAMVNERQADALLGALVQAEAVSAATCRTSTPG